MCAKPWVAEELPGSRYHVAGQLRGWFDQPGAIANDPWPRHKRW